MIIDEQTRRGYEANIWKSYLYQFLLSFQLWWPIWVVYLTDMRGLSLTQILALDSIFWLIIVIAQVPAGAVADRWSRKGALLLASLSLAIGILVFGLATNYVIILLSYAAWALAIAFQTGADNALVYDTLRMLGRESEFQKVAGRMWAMVSLGVIGGLLAGAPLAAATDLSFPILISAGIAALGALAALSLREPTVAHAEGAHAPSFASLIRESALLAYRRPTVRYVLLYAAVLGVASFVPIVFVQPFLERHDVAISDLGWFQVPNRLVGMLAALAAYRISASLGERRTFFVMPAVLVLSYVLLAGWDSAYAYAAFPIVTLVATMANPVVADYLNRRIPSAQRATILSIRQLLFSLLVAPAAPLFGVVADQMSLLAAFGAAAILLAPIPPILWLWWHSETREAPWEAVAAAPALE